MKIDSARIRQLFQEVTDNRIRLDGCERHFFDPKDMKLGKPIRCQKCGGTMQIGHAMQYASGYRAAGGNPDDVWPDLFRRKENKK